MWRTWSNRWQAVVVAVLFLGSLAALLVNTFATLALPERELRARQELREAGRKMAEKAAPVVVAAPVPTAEEVPKWDRQLHGIATAVLAEYPGVEGGFYLTAGGGVFAGYAFPTSTHEQEPDAARREPPPLETPYIRLQAQESLALGTEEPLVNVRDVGPSRVMFLAEPVGDIRPAPAAAWVMFRLVDPEQLRNDVRRYQFSSLLALGGLGLAVLLMLNYGRTLRRQRSEQEALRGELRRSEHLAALGKLLAGVAHEVRNPLAAIRSTVQLWQRLPEQSRTAGSMEAVVQAVDRLNEIVTRLLYFARSDSAQRQTVQVNEVLTETSQLLQAQADEQGVSVELDLEPNLPAVLASPSALRQVFLNLATNALQAMHHNHPADGARRLRFVSRARRQDRSMEIVVSDTGTGVSNDARAHLFEPFFTTRPEGTGLGLAICREIVLQHDGKIELVSGDGTGAVFRVILPTGERSA
jgi:signal transduction histidine kinase